MKVRSPGKDLVQLASETVGEQDRQAIVDDRFSTHPELSHVLVSRQGHEALLARQLATIARDD